MQKIGINKNIMAFLTQAQNPPNWLINVYPVFFFVYPLYPILYDKIEDEILLQSNNARRS